MPPSKTCSQIRFLIFRHPLVPLFQQSRKSDPPFLSVKVDQCMHSETSKITKTPFKRKKNCLWFAEILFVRPFDHKDFWILFFFSKRIFLRFLPNARGPPKNFDGKNFNFSKKMNSEIALLCLGKFQKEQSHEFWWTLFLFCRYCEQIHDRAGKRDPPPSQVE